MLPLKLIYFINNVYVSVCGYVNMSAVCLGPKRSLNPWSWNYRQL